MLDRLKLELSEEHARWLEAERKIPCELAAEMGIVSQGKDLAFEYRRKGQLLWRQLRIEQMIEGRRTKTFRCFAPDGRTLKEAGIDLSFWHEGDLSDESLPEAPRIITEGQFDAASFKLAGATHVVSVPNGAVDRMGEGTIRAAEDRQFAYLWEERLDGTWRLKGSLETAKKIILATDDDKAGRVLREELAVRLGRDRCWYVTYPQGCKDANDVLQKFGEERGVEILMDMIAEARPMVPSRLVKFSEIPIVKREVVVSGWPELNPHLRITRPELMVITGPPGDGKTQFATALGCNLAHYHKWPGAIIQFEDDVERNREDLIRYWCSKQGIALSIDRRPTEAEKAQACQWIDRMFRTISPNEALDDVAVNLEWLRSNIAEAATRHGARWVVIDPWNEIEHVFAKGQTEAQYLNDAIRGLKRLGRRYQIMIIIVTHPHAAGGQTADIADWSLYAISGGAVWNNKADHGVIILRPDKDDPVSFVKVSKSKRHAIMGRPGTVRMRFNPLLATYQAVGPQHEAQHSGRQDPTL
jgi:twinkle protein